jgi:hypothetical protein
MLLPQDEKETVQGALLQDRLWTTLQEFRTKKEIVEANTSTARIMGESLLQESLLQVLHSDGILSCHSQTIPHNSLVHVEFSTMVRF